MHQGASWQTRYPSRPSISHRIPDRNWHGVCSLPTTLSGDPPWLNHLTESASWHYCSHHGGNPEATLAPEPRSSRSEPLHPTPSPTPVVGLLCVTHPRRVPRTERRSPCDALQLPSLTSFVTTMSAFEPDATCVSRPDHEPHLPNRAHSLTHHSPSLGALLYNPPRRHLKHLAEQQEGEGRCRPYLRTDSRRSPDAC